MTSIKLLTLIPMTVAALAWAVVNPAEAQAPADDAVTTVQRLYRDYAWELLFRSPPRHWRALIDEPPEVLGKYFDDRLTNLIVRDRNCVARTGGECNIDGSPIWVSNDPEAAELEIEATKDSTLVQATFKRYYPAPQGSRVTLHYRMSRTSAGWRIADIMHGETSILARLQGK